jgi:hypothetical protein
MNEGVKPIEEVAEEIRRGESSQAHQEWPEKSPRQKTIDGG